jgi:O-antigen/teichoic acid export membrane protein
MRVIGIGLAVNAAASVCFMLAAAALGGGVPGAAAGSALGSATALAFVRGRTRADPALGPGVSRGAPPVAWRTIGRLAREAAPLGVVLLLCALASSVPQYFVRHVSGDAVLGLFAAATQLTATGNVVVGALGQAASPRLAAAFAAGDLRGYRALAARLAAAGLVLGAAGVALSALAGGEILTLLYGGAFAAGRDVLVVLAVAATASFVTSLLGDALTSARVIAFQPVMLSATVAGLVLGCAVLVPRHGGIGAAAALALTYAIQAVASAVVLRWFAGAPSRPALPAARGGEWSR